MKANLLKSLLLMVGAASATASLAQEAREITPMLTEGKSWLMTEKRETHGHCLRVKYLVEVSGDTIVDGLTCTKLLSRYCGRTFSEGPSEDEKAYALYEEGGKLYLVEHNPDAEASDPVMTLLLDMSCEVGDVRKVTFAKETAQKPYSYVVTKEMTQTVGDREFRKLILMTREDGSEELGAFAHWVEGVGTAYADHTLRVIPYAIPNCGPDYEGRYTCGWVIPYAMLECRVDGKPIFSYEDFNFYLDVNARKEPRRVVTDGKAWRIATVQESGRVVERRIEVSRDTVVAGQACKVLTAYEVENPAEKCSYVCYEENGRLFSVSTPENGTPVFRPLMDVTYQPGQPVGRYDATSGSFLGFDNESFKVNCLRNRRYTNSVPLRELDLGAMPDEATNMCWVEGVGSNYWRADLWMTDLSAETSANELSYLIECTQDGEVIFTAKYFSSPFEIASLSEVSAAKPAADGAVYDLMGRRVVNPIPGHIYIQDGRKVRN